MSEDLDINTKDDFKNAKKQAQHFGIEFISLKDVNIPFEVLNIIPEEIARKNELVVYKKDDKHLYIAVANAQKLQDKAPQVLMDLKQKQGYTFSLAITTKDDLYYTLLGYKQKKDFLDEERSGRTSTDEASEKEKNNERKSDGAQANDVFGNNIQKMRKIPKSVLLRFPKKIAEKYRMIVFEEKSDGAIRVAMEDIDNLQNQEILDFIAKRNNINIEKVKVEPSDIDWGIRQYDHIEPSEDIDGLRKANTSVAQAPSQDKNKASDINTKVDTKVEDQKNKQEAYDKLYKKSQLSDDESKTQDLQMQNLKPLVVSELSKSDEQDLTVKKQLSSEDEQDIDKMFPDGIHSINDIEMVVKSGSIPNMVASFLYYAVTLEASDIHIESDGSYLRVRYRIDGVLQDIIKIPMTLQAPIVSRIKIMSKLKIDEQRIPQDGRIDIVVKNKHIDLRISTLPTINGEKCVIRLLDKTTGIISLEKLGILGENSKKINDAIKKPYGIILVTGPTGSGKTTSLYAILNTLNKPSVNIVTLEDPVEYELPGINQCHIKPKIEFDFANGLRSILRQDPNIIMVGEIRDGETASMATHAALTGHLVLSTLHTNDSTSALPRLIDMGVEPFLITSSINAIIAQRLVRTLCPECKKPFEPPSKLFHEVRNTLEIARDPEIKKVVQDMKFYKPAGCEKCKDGFKGRIGLFEVLTISDRIEQLAVNRATASVIKRAALNQGLVTLRQDGFAKAALGITSIDEVIRVTK